jgi:hypothetical protein
MLTLLQASELSTRTVFELAVGVQKTYRAQIMQPQPVCTSSYGIVAVSCVGTRPQYQQSQSISSGMVFKTPKLFENIILLEYNHGHLGIRTKFIVNP